MLVKRWLVLDRDSLHHHSRHPILHHGVTRSRHHLRVKLLRCLLLLVVHESGISGLIL